MTRSSLLRYGVGLSATAAALLFLWPGLAGNLFATGAGADYFMPHGHCYLWIPSLVALHVGSDLLIGVSYTAISLTLAYLIHRARRDIPFHWVFLAFGLFIVACGATHFMEVWTLWNATYWLSGYVKLVTAAASLATAVVLPAVVPRALFLAREARSSAEHKLALEKANRKLEEELAGRLRAEEDLKRANQILEAIFQSSPLAVYAVDPDGKTLMWNPAAERIFGWGEREVIGQPLPFIPEEEQEEFRRLREQTLRGEGLTGFETRRRRRDGSPIDISISTAPLRDADGRTRGVIGVTADITKRKRAEDALRASEARLAGILDIAEDGIISIDESQRVILYNQGAEKIFGYSEEEVIGRPVDLLMPRRFAEHHGRHVRDFARSPEAARRMGERMEVYGRRKDGGEFPTEISISKLELSDETVFTAMVRDVTERKQAEAERDAERRLLDALLDQLPVGVLVADADGKYVKTNRRACEILGVGCETLVGTTVEELRRRVKALTPEGSPLTDAETPSLVALREQRPVISAETMITTPGGEVRRISANSSPIVVDGDALFGSIAVVTDVTEQYALQEQLRQSQKMESIGTLAGGVAHDFNNLLTVILGNTQLAFRGVQQDAPLRQRLVEIEKAANRATALTRQLLAFSRRQRLERKVINLNETINDFMKMLRRVIGEDIEVIVRESGRLHTVFADPTQIEQVVMNLAVNARDAMPDGGRLVIETRNVTLDEGYRRERPYASPGRYVEMTVSDTGAGMDAETRERVFEPFFTTKETGKGTGLGLSTVYGIVKQHDGLIEVESEVGRGATFRIYLPVAEKGFEEEELQEVAPPVRGGTETVLVAEDEEALRALARSVLEELGYTVLVAKDGVEAVEVYEANRERIGLLLFDIVMPRMGGREAYERLGKPGDAPPVVFLTGYSAEIVQSEFVKQNKFIEEAGAALMQKPYSVEALARKVREVLDAAAR